MLVIDTSSAAVTAAVAEIGPTTTELRAERTTVDSRAHAELLAPSIRAALSDADLRPAQLHAVVVGVGPGPFTGLRVGLVSAAAMADTLDIATYGVGSLDAIAASPPGAAAPGTLMVATDARRHEVYWARYKNGLRFDGPNVSRPGDIAAAVSISTAIGAGARMYADVLLGHAGAGAADGARRGRLLDCDHPPALALAELAADRVRGGAPTETPAPLYLRRPDAVAAQVRKPVSRR